MSFLDKLSAVEDRYVQLEKELADPAVIGNQNQFRDLSRERSGLEAIVETFRKYRSLERQIAENRELMHGADRELSAMAAEELPALETELPEIEKHLKILLLPKDPNDERNVVLEVRGGTGGEEAALFAAELMRMYLRFAELQRWKTEVLSLSESGQGGIKDVSILISGDAVYSQLKYESGVHRVQRVPATESQGRIHTSTVTVAVLPEADEVEVDIADNELRIDVYRSGGPGGQSVNTTDSAVRVTHLPTGLVVACQDEKSQHKNKAKAMKILRSRLLDLKQHEQQQAIAAERRTMVGTGDRSEKIRTYNFPQSRCTDHRVGLTSHRLPEIMNGDIGDLISACRAYFQAEALNRSDI
jgi:peptide chain release factor 1